LLTHRIPPDISSDSLDGIGWSENIVVIAFLPKTRPRGLSERKSGLLFELPNKLEEIREWRCALR